MDYYEEIMKRVKCVVEERIDVNMSVRFSNEGIDISLYCAEYDFEYAERVHYREIEYYENTVLDTVDRLVRDFERELVKNIEVK